ncbi:restriction endonuclease [Coleofasciculus sp. FACHB-SPT36]|uniref:restriction endonuclease n=1 Tax=Cyanophyceae TaxID=3028117 RepID=UPI00168B43BF|nr:restriction endonuclease [Coleofasciculus sp. FACHB-SPT36]MBD2541369.1 restriction endonuclease [Coleofasciculus sp. FACHB-SPT36]
MKLPIQKILFGSPGTGKSHRIDYTIIPEDLKITNPKDNVIKTVFHPDYTYGDFMGKLVPLTRAGKSVEYNYYEGHFLKALGRSYKNIQLTKPKSFEQINWKYVNNVALVIDEINRGNSASIFGVYFQLLDRENTGWSSYSVNLTEIEFYKFIELIGVTISLVDGNLKFQFPGDSHFVFFDALKDKFTPLGIDTENKTIRLPPNLSILATMNTSDNSIYFMDSAFKRRWDWEFINWDDSKPPAATYGKGGTLEEKDWRELIKNLNGFIKSHHASVRGIEDKQIGYYFIKQPVTTEQIQNKLMFFLWDSVFNRDKKPLVDLLEKERDELVTFGDFTKLHNDFIKKIMDFKVNSASKP